MLMLTSFCNGPGNRILNPLKLLNIRFGHTVVKGIAIIKFTTAAMTRALARGIRTGVGTRSRIRRISLI